MFGISPMMIRELMDHKMKRDSALLDLQRQNLTQQGAAESQRFDLERSKLNTLSELEKSKLSALSSAVSSSSAPRATTW